MSNAQYKAEEARQAQLMSEAINRAILETGKQFEAPILNAVGGALATNMAGVLAAIPDRRNRMLFLKAMEKAVARSLTEQLAKPIAKVETVVLGGIRQ